MADEPLPIVWLLKAEVDFQETYNRISEYSEQRAEKFYRSVNDKMAQVAMFPDIGHPYALPIRRVLSLSGRFGVFYRLQNEKVIVLGIEDLRQSPERILRNLGID